VRPGRPRDSSLDARILATTRDLLATHGYAGTSISKVAEAAGTTRPSIYLRWPTKEDLVTAAIADLPLALPLPRTDDVHADLLAELRHFHAAITRPNGMSLVGTVLAEEFTTPSLIERFRERLIIPRRSRLSDLLKRGITLGVLRDDLDIDMATHLLIGGFYARYLETSDIPPDWPERTLAALWPALTPNTR
jgi:AcrR family transcriptional regulator